MLKRWDQDLIPVDNNTENKRKENEKASKKVDAEIKSNHRKRDRHALENITQNVQDINIKVFKTSDNSSLSIKKLEKEYKSNRNGSPNTTFTVKYSLDQQILTFKSPNGKRIINTQEISPIVDEEAPGPRQSLRNLPATKPPKLQRANSTVRKIRITDGPNFENMGCEYKQYKQSCIQNMEQSSWMHIIDRRFLHAFDPIMKNRNQTIMWLIEVNKMFQERCCVLLNATRIFDHMLASAFIPRKLYVLVASTAFLISAKVDNMNHTSIHTFIKSNVSYTKEQYLRLELKILHLLNYNLNMIDPTLIVDYICMKMEEHNPKIKNMALLYHSSYFFLELFSLDCSFSSTCPIVMATAAVRASIKLLPTYRNHVGILDDITASVKPETSGFSINVLKIHSKMIFLLTLACERTHTFHELFQKYYTDDYCHATKELRNNISREITL